MNNVIKKLIALAFLGIFCSCSSSTTTCEEIVFEQEFSAKLNDEFCFDDGENTLEIIKVEDHVCPCDAICVWHGFVALGLKATIDGQIYEGILTDIDSVNINSQIQLPDNYRLQMRDQIPASLDICGGQIKAEDFRWNLVLSKR